MSKLSGSNESSYLLTCLKSGHLDEFSSSKPDEKGSQEKAINFDIFGSCKLLLVWYHNKNKDSNIPQRDAYQNWCHRKCEHIPNNMIDPKTSIK